MQANPIGGISIRHSILTGASSSVLPPVSIQGKPYHLNSKTYVMGIINLTPDSFSSDGLYGRSDYIDRAVQQAKEMVDAGAEQKVFAEMWGYVPQGMNVPASPRGKVFNIATLIPAKTKVYRYRGSLTTPPCAENVLWSVAADKMTFSKEQIDAFRMRYKNNARPIQKRSTLAH